MALKPGLRISQTQRLVLTPSLRQSLNVLSLSSVDIDRLIETEIAENPLLLREEYTSQPKADYDFALDTVSEQTTLADHLTRQIRLASGPGEVRDLATYLAHDLDERGYLQDTLEEMAATHDVAAETVNAAITLLQSCDPAGIGARDLADCLDLQLRESDLPTKQRHLITGHLTHFAKGDWT